MANKVTNVDGVTQAMSGVALAERTVPLTPSWLPALRGVGDTSARLVRSHLQRLPERAREVTPAVIEEPLIETDTAPGFSGLRRVGVRRGPISDLCVDSATGRLHAVNHSDSSVTVLDRDTLAVRAVHTDLAEPFAIAAAGGRAFVSSVTMAYDAIAVLDGSEPTLHPLALSVRDLAASPDGRRVYVARSGRDDADVAAIDTADDGVITFKLGTRRGAAAEAIAISGDGTRVYVVTVDEVGGELAVIDTDGDRVIGGLAFDTPLRDVAVSADGTVVYVASFDPAAGAVVDVVDTERLRVVDSVVLGGAVTQLMVAVTGERLYVVNGDRITVVCTRTFAIVDTITAVDEPSCIAQSVDGSSLFIADYAGNITALTDASNTMAMLAAVAPMLELEPARV